MPEEVKEAEDLWALFAPTDPDADMALPEIV